MPLKKTKSRATRQNRSTEGAVQLEQDEIKQETFDSDEEDQERLNFDQVEVKLEVMDSDQEDQEVITGDRNPQHVQDNNTQFVELPDENKQVLQQTHQLQLITLPQQPENFQFVAVPQQIPQLQLSAVPNQVLQVHQEPVSQQTQSNLNPVQQLPMVSEYNQNVPSGTRLPIRICVNADVDPFSADLVFPKGVPVGGYVRLSAGKFRKTDSNKENIFTQKVYSKPGAAAFTCVIRHVKDQDTSTKAKDCFKLKSLSKVVSSNQVSHTDNAGQISKEQEATGGDLKKPLQSSREANIWRNTSDTNGNSSEDTWKPVIELVEGAVVEKPGSMILVDLAQRSYCSTLKTDVAALEIHKQKFRSDREFPYKCSDCKKSFFNKIVYKSHIKNCKKSRRERKELKRKHLADEDEDTNTWKKKKNIGTIFFSCEFCPAFCHDYRDLVKHMLVNHPDQEQFACSTCDKIYVHEPYLFSHQLKHKEGKSSKCPYCAEVLNHTSSFRLHLINHCSAKLYKCSFCDARFKFRSSLHSHMTSCHTIQRSTNDICDQTFTSSPTCKHHKNKIHDDACKFNFKYCDVKSTKIGRLTAHLKSSSPNQSTSEEKVTKPYRNFVIVKFLEEEDAPGLAAGCWISESGTSCRVPNVVTNKAREKLLKTQSLPRKDWITCPIQIMEEHDTFEKAMYHLKRIEPSRQEEAFAPEKQMQKKPVLPKEDSGKDEDLDFSQIDFLFPASMFCSQLSTDSTPTRSMELSPPMEDSQAPSAQGSVLNSNGSQQTDVSNRVYTSECSGCSKLKSGINQLIEMMTDLHETTTQLQKKLDLVLSEKLPSFTEIDNEDFSLLSNLPITSEADFKIFNEKLAKSVQFQQRYFQMLGTGSKTPKQLIQTMLRRLLADDLAEVYSLTGKSAKNDPPKQSFVKTHLYNFILTSSKKLFRNSTEEEVRGFISEWLHQAKIRRIRRKHRT